MRHRCSVSFVQLQEQKLVYISFRELVAVNAENCHARLNVS